MGSIYFVGAIKDDVLFEPIEAVGSTIHLIDNLLEPLDLRIESDFLYYDEDSIVEPVIYTEEEFSRDRLDLDFYNHKYPIICGRDVFIDTCFIEKAPKMNYGKLKSITDYGDSIRAGSAKNIIDSIIKWHEEGKTIYFFKYL